MQHNWHLHIITESNFYETIRFWVRDFYHIIADEGFEDKSSNRPNLYQILITEKMGPSVCYWQVY